MCTVDTNTHLYLLPSSVKQKYNFPAWCLGLCLAFIFPVHPNARFPPARWSGLPSWVTLLLLLAGGVLRNPFSSAVNVLLPQHQCHLSFEAFLRFPSHEQWLPPLKVRFFFITLWSRCYIRPCNVALCGKFFCLPQGRKPFDSCLIS